MSLLSYLLNETLSVNTNDWLKRKEIRDKDGKLLKTVVTAPNQSSDNNKPQVDGIVYFVYNPFNPSEAYKIYPSNWKHDIAGNINMAHSQFGGGSPSLKNRTLANSLQYPSEKEFRDQRKFELLMQQPEISKFTDFEKLKKKYIKNNNIDIDNLDEIQLSDLDDKIWSIQDKYEQQIRDNLNDYMALLSQEKQDEINNKVNNLVPITKDYIQQAVLTSPGFDTKEVKRVTVIYYDDYTSGRPASAEYQLMFGDQIDAINKMHPGKEGKLEPYNSSELKKYIERNFVRFYMPNDYEDMDSDLDFNKQIKDILKQKRDDIRTNLPKWDSQAVGRLSANVPIPGQDDAKLNAIHQLRRLENEISRKPEDIQKLYQDVKNKLNIKSLKRQQLLANNIYSFKNAKPSEYSSIFFDLLTHNESTIANVITKVLTEIIDKPTGSNYQTKPLDKTEAWIYTVLTHSGVWFDSSTFIPKKIKDPSIIDGKINYYIFTNYINELKNSINYDSSNFDTYKAWLEIKNKHYDTAYEALTSVNESNIVESVLLQSMELLTEAQRTDIPYLVNMAKFFFNKVHEQDGQHFRINKELLPGGSPMYINADTLFNDNTRKRNNDYFDIEDDRFKNPAKYIIHDKIIDTGNGMYSIVDYYNKILDTEGSESAVMCLEDFFNNNEIFLKTITTPEQKVRVYNNLLDYVDKRAQNYLNSMMAQTSIKKSGYNRSKAFDDWYSRMGVLERECGKDNEELWDKLELSKSVNEDNNKTYFYICSILFGDDYKPDTFESNVILNNYEEFKKLALNKSTRKMSELWMQKWNEFMKENDLDNEAKSTFQYKQKKQQNQKDKQNKIYQKQRTPEIEKIKRRNIDIPQ